MSPIQFLLCVAIVTVGGAAGNLIRGKSDGPVFPAKDSHISKLGDEVSSPMELLDLPGEKQCREIGDSCVYHSDCCSFACLGYLKKCVTGSG